MYRETYQVLLVQSLNVWLTVKFVSTAFEKSICFKSGAARAERILTGLLESNEKQALGSTVG